MAKRNVSSLAWVYPVALIVSVLTLHRTYYLIDVMVLYTLLLAVAPIALYLLVEGRTRFLLLASWGLWLAFQLAPEYAEVPWEIAGNYLFHFSAWQVFFFTAMAIGYHRDRLARGLPRRVQWLLLLLSGLAFAGLVVLYRLGDRVWEWLVGAHPALIGSDNLLVLLFGKGDVRPGRLLASLVVFGFFYLFVTLAWRPLYRALGWLLMPLGANALYAYAAHIVLVTLVGVALLPLGPLGRASNTLLQIAGVLVLWLLIRFRVCFPTPETRLRWSLVPPVLAVLALIVIPLNPSSTAPSDFVSAHVAPCPNQARSCSATQRCSYEIVSSRA